MKHGWPITILSLACLFVPLACKKKASASTDSQKPACETFSPNGTNLDLAGLAITPLPAIDASKLQVSQVKLMATPINTGENIYNNLTLLISELQTDNTNLVADYLQYQICTEQGTVQQCLCQDATTVCPYATVASGAQSAAQWNEATAGSTDGSDPFTTSLQLPLPPGISDVLAAQVRLCVRDNRKTTVDNCGPWSSPARYHAPKNESSPLAQLKAGIQQLTKSLGDLAFSLGQSALQYEQNLASVAPKALTNTEKSLLLQAKTFTQFPDSARQLLQNPDQYQSFLSQVQSSASPQGLALAANPTSACVPTDAGAISALLPPSTVTELQIQTLTYTNNGTETTTLVQVDPGIPTTITLNDTQTVTINGTVTQWSTQTDTVTDTAFVTNVVTETITYTQNGTETTTVIQVTPGSTATETQTEHTSSSGGVSTAGKAVGGIAAAVAFGGAIYFFVQAGVTAYRARGGAVSVAAVSVAAPAVEAPKTDILPAEIQYDPTSNPRTGDFKNEKNLPMKEIKPTRAHPSHITPSSTLQAYDWDGTVTKVEPTQSAGSAPNYADGTINADHIKQHLKTDIAHRLYNQLLVGDGVVIVTNNRVSETLQKNMVEALTNQYMEQNPGARRAKVQAHFERISLFGRPQEINGSPESLSDGKTSHIEQALKGTSYTRVNFYDNSGFNIENTKVKNSNVELTAVQIDARAETFKIGVAGESQSKAGDVKANTTTATELPKTIPIPEKLETTKAKAKASIPSETKTTKPIKSKGMSAKASGFIGAAFLVMAVVLGVFASGAFLAGGPRDEVSQTFLQDLTNGYTRYQQLSAKLISCQTQLANEIAQPGSGQLNLCQAL